VFQEFRGDPDVDQEVLKFKRISSVLDADAANELLIPKDDQTRQIEAAREQELELTTMMTGKPVPVSPRDNHPVHISFLLQDLGTKIQGQAQNFNPDEISVMKLETAHCAEHLQYLASDPSKKQVADQLKEKIQEAVNGIKILEKQKFDLARAAANQAGKIAKTPQEMAQVQAMHEHINQQNPEGAPQTV
jgi:hypothetical protein